MTKETEPGSLVGSGAPVVAVRANVGVMGLAAGESGNLSDNDETRANLANGNLVAI